MVPGRPRPSATSWKPSSGVSGAARGKGGRHDRRAPAPQDRGLEVTGGDQPRVRVGDLVDIGFERMMTEDGKQTTVVNAPIAAGLGVETMELAGPAGR